MKVPMYKMSMYLAKGDGWLSREMGAPACYGSSLGSNHDISQKYKMGDKSKEWPKKYPKKYILETNSVEFSRVQ